MMLLNTLAKRVNLSLSSSLYSSSYLLPLLFFKNSSICLHKHTPNNTINFNAHRSTHNNNNLRFARGFSTITTNSNGNDNKQPTKDDNNNDNNNNNNNNLDNPNENENKLTNSEPTEITPTQSESNVIDQDNTETQHNATTMYKDDAFKLLDPKKPKSKAMEKHLDVATISSQKIRDFIFLGYIDKAFEVFQTMQRGYYPVPKDVYTLLREKIALAFQDLVKSPNLFPQKEHTTQPHQHSINTLSIIMDFFTETDRLVDAFSLLSAMKEGGLQPTPHMYKSLLNGCMRYDDIELGMITFDIMRGDDIVLEYSVYHRLFDLACAAVYPLGAQVILEEILKHHELPNVNKYLLMTSLVLTAGMGLVKLPPSVRGGRGYVTSMQLDYHTYIFPPKIDDNKLLDPDFGIDTRSFFRHLRKYNYGILPLSALPPPNNNNNNNNDTNKRISDHSDNTDNNKKQLPFNSEKTEGG